MTDLTCSVRLFSDEDRAPAHRTSTFALETDGRSAIGTWTRLKTSSDSRIKIPTSKGTWQIIYWEEDRSSTLYMSRGDTKAIFFSLQKLSAHFVNTAGCGSSAAGTGTHHTPFADIRYDVEFLCM